MSDFSSLPPCPFKVRVLHSYEPCEQKEIPLLANTIVNVQKVHGSGWWRGEYNGKSGWFPSSHVELFVDQAPQSMQQPVEPHESKISGIRTSLSRLFTQRSKRRDLERRGVLASDETRVFGRTIWDIAERDKGAGVRHNIPLFLDRCFEVLWTSGFTVEGLFRVSVSQEVLLSYKEQLDKDQTQVEFNLDADSRVCAGLVKFFIREHPEPLITRALYPKYLTLCDQNVSIDERVSTMAELIKAEPIVTRAFLSQLLAFLHDCSTNHSQRMKMLPKAYAIIFGPVIITDSVETTGCNLADIQQQIDSFEFLVENWEQISQCAGIDRYGGLLESSSRSSSLPTEQSQGQSNTFEKNDIVRAFYNFDPEEDDKKMRIQVGDYIRIERHPDKGWCKGVRFVDGRPSQEERDRGWFPSSYVRAVSEEERLMLSQ